MKYLIDINALVAFEFISQVLPLLMTLDEKVPGSYRIP